MTQSTSTCPMSIDRLSWLLFLVSPNKNSWSLDTISGNSVPIFVCVPSSVYGSSSKVPFNETIQVSKLISTTSPAIPITRLTSCLLYPSGSHTTMSPLWMLLVHWIKIKFPFSSVGFIESPSTTTMRKATCNSRNVTTAATAMSRRIRNTVFLFSVMACFTPSTICIETSTSIWSWCVPPYRMRVYRHSTLRFFYNLLNVFFSLREVRSKLHFFSLALVFQTAQYPSPCDLLPAG